MDLGLAVAEAAAVVGAVAVVEVVAAAAAPRLLTAIICRCRGAVSAAACASAAAPDAPNAADSPAAAAVPNTMAVRNSRSATGRAASLSGSMLRHFEGSALHLSEGGREGGREIKRSRS